MPIVLVIADQDSRQKDLAEMLRGLGHLTRVQTPDEATRSPAERLGIEVGIVLAGPRMFPTGLLINRLRTAHPGVPFVFVTQAGEQQRAIEAISAGAHDFLTWPIEADRLGLTVRNALLAKPGTAASPVDDSLFSEFVGRSDVLMQLLLKARAQSLGRSHLLVRGERGVGKTMLARAMHLFGGQELDTLQTIGTRVEEALPLELARCRVGGTVMIDLPEGGLLDENDGIDIDRIGAIARERELRLLLCQRLPRHDGPVVPPAPRILDALQPEVLTIPPLRERPADSEAQCDFFLARSAQMLQRPALKPTGQARRLLCGHDWPGNTRELIDTVFRAHLMSDGPFLAASQIESLLAPDGQRSPVAGRPTISPFNGQGDLRRLEEIEADYMKLAFHVCRKNRSEIARQLGIGRTTLYRKARHLDLM